MLSAFAYAGLLPYGNKEASGTPLFVIPKGVVIFLGVLCFIVFLAEGAILDWSAVFLIASHDLDVSQAGLGYTVFATAMTVGRLTGDSVVAALGGTRVVLIGGLVAAAGFLLAVLAPIPILAFGGYLLIGLGASNIVPVFFTAAGQQKAMPASLAIAAITTLGYAGILIGPAAIGLVAQYANLGTAFLGIAALLLFVAVAGTRVTRIR